VSWREVMSKQKSGRPQDGKVTHGDLSEAPVPQDAAGPYSEEELRRMDDAFTAALEREAPGMNRKRDID
jgi:hypothetical protein